MAELNLNYDLPWMQQKPDSNQPMSLAEAFQLKQRQQQIDTEKALLPLRQQEMQAQIANQALDHTIKQEQFDVSLKMKANSSELWDAYGKVHWDVPEDVSQFWGKVAEKGGLADPAILKMAHTSTELGQQYKLKEEQFRLKALDDAAKQREINERQQQRFAQQEKMVRLKSDLEKDALAIRQAGRAVSFDEFYNRHLNKFLEQGLDTDAASKEMRRVYDAYLNKGGSTPLAIPVNPKDPASIFTQ